VDDVLRVELLPARARVCVCVCVRACLRKCIYASEGRRLNVQYILIIRPNSLHCCRKSSTKSFRFFFLFLLFNAEEVTKDTQLFSFYQQAREDLFLFLYFCFSLCKHLLTMFFSWVKMTLQLL
jgi:hypothetical protein